MCGINDETQVITGSPYSCRGLSVIDGVPDTVSVCGSYGSTRPPRGVRSSFDYTSAECRIFKASLPRSIHYFIGMAQRTIYFRFAREMFVTSGPRGSTHIILSNRLVTALHVASFLLVSRYLIFIISHVGTSESQPLTLASRSSCKFFDITHVRTSGPICIPNRFAGAGIV